MRAQEWHQDGRAGVLAAKGRFKSAIDVGRFSGAMPDEGIHGCGVELRLSGAGEIGISFLRRVRACGG